MIKAAGFTVVVGLGVRGIPLGLSPVQSAETVVSGSKVQVLQS
jgi:hypothetical protein